MSSVSEQQKFKLLILQIRFLKEKLSLHRQTESEAGALFSKEFKETLKEMPDEVVEFFKKQEKGQESAKQSEQEGTQDTQEAHPQEADAEDETTSAPQDPDREVEPKKQAPKHLKYVYREVAKITHPDKLKDLPELERLQKENLFIKAQKAFSNENFIDLMDVALHLNVKFPDPTEEDVGLAKGNVEKVRLKIKTIEKSTAWRWYHSDEDEKVLLMKDYINYVYHNMGN